MYYRACWIQAIVLSEVDFWEKNVPKLADFEDFILFWGFEIAIFRQ
jgi:hypothetical protein